jgi:peptide deformylase
LKKYELKYYPDPVLREISSPVTEIDKVIHQLIKGMSKIMYDHKGIGLAAPQVGILKRVIMADIGDGLITMINPEILTGFGEELMEEGCLSIKDVVTNIKRKQSIFVRYLDKNENEKESELSGLIARIIQHEVDHLNGVLIIDYSPFIEKLKVNVNNKLKY